MPDREKPPPPGKPDPLDERDNAAEHAAERRTPGRSEKSEELEQQLEEGLEDTFPASDPPLGRLHHNRRQGQASERNRRGLAGTQEGAERTLIDERWRDSAM